MSDMQDFESTSTLFGGNVPFIEEQYEHYLANPASVPADWRTYFDSLRGGAADVAHAPVIESFIRLGKSRKVAGAMVDAATMHKQVLVLQLIGKFRTLGMFNADLDPLNRQEKRYIPDLDVSTYGFTEADLDTEFEGKHAQELSAGDVKYHQGFSSDVVTPGGPMHLTLAFNPSHLEAVDPVVEGSVRARQHRRGDESGDQVLPVLIHGDAALAGQGVIQEILNMAQTRGYYTGGTIHIVVNNQIGFTTSDPRDTRGTLYCTDIAKMAEAPIFHVNADDPEVCMLAIEMAMEYRQEFHRDVFIDLVCFRRLGHNEADEPMITQPLMYKRIAQHPGTRKLYADVLVREGVVKAEDADAMIATYRAAMDKGMHTNTTILSNYKPPFSVDWSAYKGRTWTEPCDTRVPMATLKAVATAATTVPEGFKVHPRVERVLADRRAMGEGKQPLTGEWPRRSPTGRC